MAIGSRSSTEENAYPLSRWLLPSVADLIFIALLGLLSFTALSVRLLGDAGIGWHIRTGQMILASHTIPRVDSFSASMAGQPWFAWEWLYDVLVGRLDIAAGLNGIVVFTALIIALTFSWTYLLLFRRGTNLLAALGLVLLAASAAMIHFFARPHVLSWLFTVIWFYLLDSSEVKQIAGKQKDWPLWLLPLSMVIWVNLHGGFLLGLALLAIYWLSAVWLYFRLPEDRFDDVLLKLRVSKRIRDLTLVGLISGLATFINPYGWRLHVHIYRYLSNHFLMDHIDEFQSPNFHGVAQKCFAVLLMLALLAFASRNRGGGSIRISELLLVLLAVYSALYASRNIPTSALLLILVIGPRLSNAVPALVATGRRRDSKSGSQDSLQFLERMQAIESSLHSHVWPIVAVILTCWITLHGGELGTKPVMNARFDDHRFPAAALDYLAQHNLPFLNANGASEHVAVFAPDYWGGYLIYRFYPQIKVVIDDRHDFYGEKFLKSYLKTMHVEPGWKDFLDHYLARFVIVPKDSAIANILAETPAWQPIYSDEVAVIFTPVGH
jgi:hypothetical protein